MTELNPLPRYDAAYYEATKNIDHESQAMTEHAPQAAAGECWDCGHSLGDEHKWSCAWAGTVEAVDCNDPYEEVRRLQTKLNALEAAVPTAAVVEAVELVLELALWDPDLANEEGQAAIAAVRAWLASLPQGGGR